MKKGNEATAIFERLIADGCHWLMIADQQTTTVQPLTDAGYKALCEVLRRHGVDERTLQRMGRKRHGHYNGALPMKSGAGTLALMLANDFGLAGVAMNAGTKLEERIVPDLKIVPGKPEGGPQ